MKQKTYKVSEKDLPLSCPLKGSQTNGSHPKVFLKFNDKGEATCYYCGTHYSLDEA